jgi:DNA-binding MarR family transcriptional regulator
MPRRPRLIFLINSAQRHLQQWISGQQAAATKRLGSTAPTAAQAGALFALHQQDGATMGQLAQALGLEPPAVSGLVQRIEALGWAQRLPCPEDGRTQRVWLLPTGRAQIPHLRQAMETINAQLTAGFTDAELQVVARWLEHVRQLPSPTPTQG